MYPIKLILTFIIAIFSLTTLNTAIAEKHHSQAASFKATKITDQIYMLQGKGGNLGLLKGKQGLVLIDADYKQMSPALIKQLSRYGGTEKLNYLINTHWHGDHTEGNDALGRHAQIIAHDNVRARLLTTQEIKLFKLVSKPYPVHALPSITYKKSMSLYLNNEELELIHFSKSHTDGDTVVFFKKSNVVHTGDLFFSGFYPFVDVDHGGNVLNLAKNIKMLLGMVDDKTRIIPGHGPLSDKSALQDFHDMLVGTTVEVQSMIDKGMGLDKIKQTGLSNKWKSWTKGFLSTEVWIGIIYSSLTKG